MPGAWYPERRPTPSASLLTTFRLRPDLARRDVRLDLLRGFCVVHMIVVHLAWRGLNPHLTLGWATAAEGFFLISGATLGLIWGRADASGRSAPLRRRLARRGIGLYLANLVLIVAAYRLEAAPAFRAAAAARRWGETAEPARWLAFDHPAALDVLPRYAVLLLGAALALPLLRRRAGALAVGAASLALWAAQLATGKELLLPGLETPRASFPVASWQLLFVAGILLGRFALRPHPAEQRRLPWRWLAAAAAATLGFVIAQALLPGGAHRLPSDLAPWLDRATLAPLRLVNVAAAATLLWLAVTRWRETLVRACGWLLLPFGRHALAAFLLHLPLIWIGLGLAAPPGLRWVRPAATAAVVLGMRELLRVLDRRAARRDAAAAPEPVVVSAGG